MDAGTIRGGDDVLRRGAAGGDHVNANFDLPAHQSGGIVHAGLVVDDELLWQKMQRLAIIGQTGWCGPSRRQRERRRD